MVINTIGILCYTYMDSKYLAHTVLYRVRSRAAWYSTDDKLFQAMAGVASVASRAIINELNSTDYVDMYVLFNAVQIGRLGYRWLRRGWIPRVYKLSSVRLFPYNTPLTYYVQ